ncbi:MAG TPA: RNA polymerase sigma factor region1.1 domain-containing protein, partial [Chthoniobacteraceae bacterium]
MPKSNQKASAKSSKPASEKPSTSPKKKPAPVTSAKKSSPGKKSNPAKAVKPVKAVSKTSKPAASKPAAKQKPVAHGKNGGEAKLVQTKEVSAKARKPAVIEAPAAPAKADKKAKVQPVAMPISVIDRPDVQEKLRELLKLAKEQGYLTFDDLNEALPDNVNDPDEMEIIMGRIRSMEIDIIEASDVDRYKDGKKQEDAEEEEEKPEAKLDILDDPVRMYLKQMGQVPLLTREQEVEISKRIEEAELNVQKFVNRFGFIARAYLDLAQKLAEGRERFDRIILDKKIESRERYMKMLPKLCQSLENAANNCINGYKNHLANTVDGAQDPKT